VPPFRLFRHWLQSFGLVISGAVIGAAGFMLVFQHNMNELLMVNAALRSEKETLAEEIEALKNYKDQQTVIKSVQVQMEQPPDKERLEEIIAGEIKKRVYEDLKIFVGKPISVIDQDPQAVRSLFGKKPLLGINEKDYVAEINTIMVMNGELKIWLKVNELARN
jgi:hypothetical protein